MRGPFGHPGVGGKTVLLLSRCGWQDGTAGSVPTASVSSRGTGRELNRAELYVQAWPMPHSISCLFKGRQVWGLVRGGKF